MTRIFLRDMISFAAGRLMEMEVCGLTGARHGEKSADRLSFQRFLRLGLDGTVPDATTVWLFRERLVQAKAIDKLFARFDAALTDRGYLATVGQIIDATVVPAPKQRNTEEEKAAIREGRIPETWKAKPARLCQKERDARWSVKYTKAKVKEGADPKAAKPVDLAIPMFG